MRINTGNFFLLIAWVMESFFFLFQRIYWLVNHQQCKYIFIYVRMYRETVCIPNF